VYYKAAGCKHADGEDDLPRDDTQTGRRDYFFNRFQQNLSAKLSSVFNYLANKVVLCMNQKFNVSDYPDGLERAIISIHGKWGREKNSACYKDAIENSTNGVSALRGFYLMVRSGEIISCFALIINDFISGHDLYPWLACLLSHSIVAKN